MSLAWVMVNNVLKATYQGEDADLDGFVVDTTYLWCNVEAALQVRCCVEAKGFLPASALVLGGTGDGDYTV